MSSSRYFASSFYYHQDGPNNKVMFSEDEDSRDSGIGDMDCGPCSLKENYCGDSLFILDEEMEDLVINENSPRLISHKLKTKRTRCLGDITNGQENSPVSRKSGFFRTKSSLVVRKRTLPNLDYHTKRQKDDENNENQQPAAHGPPTNRPRSLLRAFSTSTLEVHRSPAAADDLPQPLPVNYSLPVVAGNADSVAFKRIEAATLSHLLSSMTSEDFLARYLLVDCRYPYEFEGGHIQHAVNLYDPTLCEKYFFGSDFDSKRIPIFYCEYSQKRGPGMATTLRGADRVRNVDRYPHVNFQEIYVLDKGYKGFYEALSYSGGKALCSPCNYIKMDDPQFSHILKSLPFHKRYSTAATCVKPENKSRVCLARQTSHDSPVGRRPNFRRPLFVAATPEIKLDPLRLTYSPDTPAS